MMQTFEYPNLLKGTRDKSNPLDLHNASQTKEKTFSLWIGGASRKNQIKPYTDYTLSFWVDRTDNMKSSDVILIDIGVRYTPVWSADRYQIPAGGGTSRGRSKSTTSQVKNRDMSFASTTTARRTARTRCCACGTPCLSRAPRPAPGRRQRGRCGLNER